MGSCLRGARVLVTGGAGMIGSTIIDHLVREEVAEILVLDNLVRGSVDNLAWAMSNGPICLIDGDVRDRELVGQITDGADVIFHLAAIRITQCADDPRLALDVLANGTFNVLEAAVHTGVRKVVAASSASVYGLAEVFPTSESHHPFANRTLYGAAKVFNEGMLRSFNEMHDLDYVALRFFNVYGPRMDLHGAYTEVLVRWIDRIAAGERPIIMGDGSQTMDFVYIEDVARANVLAAKSGVTDEVFNIASGVETSLNALVNTLLYVMGSTLRPVYQPERKVNAVRRRLADVSAARDRIGFEAEADLETGLRRLVAWWQEQKTVPAAAFG